MKLIYVVDDEKNIRDLICSYLKKEGYETEAFSDGESLFCRFRDKPADMLILDVMMPGIDGYSLCRKIREICNVPIIMVSAKDQELDKVLGLELGSDDYIAKPFSPRELVARVKTIFRRAGEASETERKPSRISVRDITIIPDQRRVCLGELDIEMTAKEFDFLLFLALNKNRVFTREQLLEAVWGYNYVSETRSVDDVVKRVRKKLDRAGSSVEIATVWGYGYKLVE